MPAPINSQPRQRNRPRPNLLRRWLTITLKLLLSPLVLIWDALRRRGRLDQTWLFNFFILTTVLLTLTGIGLFVMEEPLFRSLRMMATITQGQEVLAGDLQPVVRAINRYALRYNVDPSLIYAIVKSESSFRPTAVSSAGARGLMQLQPKVWREFGEATCSGEHDPPPPVHSGDCIFDPEANIRVGVKYFRSLLDHYQGRVDLALEAYNAGITNVQSEQEPRYDETKDFIEQTLRSWQEMKKYALDQQLKLTLRLQHGLKWLFGLSFACWLILFWWVNRRWLTMTREQRHPEE